MNDDPANDFQNAFAANYGYGANEVGFPWDDILAMLLSLLDGCFMNRTPREMAEASNGLIARARMKSKLLQLGVPASMRDRIVASAVKTLKGAPDEKLESWFAAARNG